MGVFLHQINWEPGEEEPGDGVDKILSEKYAQHHAVREQLLDVMQFGSACCRTARLFVVHIDHRAIFRDKLQLFRRHTWVICRVMNQLDPQRRQHKTNHPHNGKDVLPAPGESQPAKQRRKERQREILRRVKDGGGSTTFFRREPGGDNTGVRRE